MLVLSRKVGERIVINENITIVVNRVGGNRVTLGIEAPNDVPVIRGELEAAIREFRDPVDLLQEEPAVEETCSASQAFPRLAIGDVDSSSPTSAAG